MSKFAGALISALIALNAGEARAQLAGRPYIHDPSTVTFSDGKFYTFGTGRGGLVSEDGWTWSGAGAVRPGGGLAPARWRPRRRSPGRANSCGGWTNSPTAPTASRPSRPTACSARSLTTIGASALAHAPLVGGTDAGCWTFNRP